MITKAFLAFVAVGIAGVILMQQWRLNRTVKSLQSQTTQAVDREANNQAARFQEMESRYRDAKAEQDLTQQKLAAADSRIADLNRRVQQLESGRARSALTRPTGTPDEILVEGNLPSANGPKRAWGPEQIVGAPDTFEAGDISTAWASREQDAGEEWLKLDYENAVDIAEVRIRETHNPGAVSKITAFLANGNEVVLWEGIEPAALAPVEMSFQVVSPVHARSVKVYLDTQRVPGWNEVDAVELIGRDGSHQWVTQATASSTYAEPRITRTGFENL